MSAIKFKINTIQYKFQNQLQCSGHFVLDEEAIDKPEGGFQVIVNDLARYLASAQNVTFNFVKIQDSNVQATLYLIKRL